MGAKVITMYCLLIIVANIYWTYASELVPVYMWSKDKTRGSLPSLSHINQETFKELIKKIEAESGNRQLLVFAEENLSPEDFVSLNGKSTYHALEAVSEHRTYFPTVSSPLEAIEELVPDIQTVSINELSKSPKTLTHSNLIITLDDAKDDEDRVDMLRRHSKFIADYYNKVENKHVLAIYTGYHSSWIVPNEIRKQRHERSTTEEPEPKPVLGATTNFLLYVNGTFSYFKEGATEPTTFTYKAVTQTDKTLTIETSLGNLELNYDYYPETRYWYIRSATYTNAKVTFPSDIYAPQGFSYSCSNNLTLKYAEMITSTKYVHHYLKLANFQLQYFPDKVPTENKRFGDSYDCVGFTSAPIWSGLFVTFILVGILSMGLTMIMDIKTMDRFDDPKGKTIIINAVE